MLNFIYFTKHGTDLLKKKKNVLDIHHKDVINYTDINITTGATTGALGNSSNVIPIFSTRQEKKAGFKS